MAGGAYQWEIYNFNNSNADYISSNHKSDITLDHTRADRPVTHMAALEVGASVGHSGIQNVVAS